jgi:hypothetical protein
MRKTPKTSSESERRCPTKANLFLPFVRQAASSAAIDGSIEKTAASCVLHNAEKKDCPDAKEGFFAVPHSRGAVRGRYAAVLSRFFLW